MYFITLCTKNKEHILCNIVPVGDGALDVPKYGAPDVQLNDTNTFCHSADTAENVQIILSPIGKLTEEHIININRYSGITVDKYVIMPNHIHLLISVSNHSASDKALTCTSGTSKAPSPTNAVIPKIIGGLKRVINKKVGNNIFQRSYHDHIIRNDKDYKNIWEYIDKNPVKWNEDCFYTE